MRIVLLSFMLCSFAVSAAFEKVDIQVNDKSYSLELADDIQKRSLGLMFRKELCQDCGMLFAYSRPRVLSFWMKNTYIPLDIAYLDSQGVIVAIKAMEPLDLNPVSSDKPVQYAWEMNRDWFKTNKVKVGDRVKGLSPNNN